MTPSRTLRSATLVLVVTAGLAAAAPALAVDRCVAISGCTAGNTFTAAQLPDALTAAGAAGSGRLLIGPGTFVAPAGGFVLSTAGAVEIVGAGAGATVIQTGPGQADFTYALRLLNGASTIRDLTVRTIHPNVRALLLAGTARARQIRAEGTTTGTNSWGVFLEGSGAGPVLEDSTVSMRGVGSTAVAMNSVSALRTSTLTADRGIISSNPGGSAGVSRVRVTATGSTGVGSDGGSLVMTDSLISVTAPGATAISAVNLNNGVTPIAMTFDRVTVTGNDAAGQVGVTSQANSAGGDTAAVTLRNTILTRLAVPLRRVASPSGAASITTSFTNHALTGIVDQSSGAGTGTITETARTEHPVAFVDLAGGDLRPAPGSPLIDAGDPADAGTLDLAGAARPLDGNGDGAARVDLGAFESPALAPAPAVGTPALVPLADRTRPRITRLKVTLVGRSARIRARISERGTLRVRIARVGVKGSRLRVVPVRRSGPFAASIRLATAGRYRITVVARDRAGNVSVPKVRALRLAPLRRAVR